jgi:hypothetical protein
MQLEYPVDFLSLSIRVEPQHGLLTRDECPSVGASSNAEALFCGRLVPGRRIR